MCGLAGLARHPEAPEFQLAKDVFNRLLVEAESRGRQATGFAVRESKGKTRIHKVAEKASVVVSSDAYKALMTELKPNTTIVMGHTRNATHANGHRDEAAHPFREGKIVGAHNGIINNWLTLEKELGRKDIIVDSQVIFALLDKEKDPEVALQKLNGYFALTWIKDTELFMIRSDYAPTACAYVQSLRTMFWHSEMHKLRNVLKEAGLEKDCAIWENKTEVLYRYDPICFTESSAAGTRREIKLPQTESRKYFQRWGGVTSGATQAAPALSRKSYQDWWEGDGWDEPDTLPAKVHTPRKKLGQESLSDLKDRIDSLEGLFRSMAKAFKKIASDSQRHEVEVEFIMNVLDEHGFLGGEPEEEFPETCAICDRPENDEQGKLVDYHGEQKVHEQCVFANC